MSHYENLAARRFLEYKWKKRKEALDAFAFSIAVGVLKHVAPFLDSTGLVRRRSVEKVSVE